MFLNSLVRTRLTYGCHTWRPSSAEVSKINATYNYFLRCMIWNGHQRVNPPPRSNDQETSAEDLPDFDPELYDWSYTITNEKLYEIAKVKSITQDYELQQIK